MTNEDRPRLARILSVLGDTFAEPITDQRAEGYYIGLQDLTIGQIEFAAREALRLSKFFPRPAELRALAMGTSDDAAELAWLAVRNEVRRIGLYGAPDLSSDVLNAIDATWGSWRDLCATLPNEGPELLGWAKRFKTTYEALANRQRITTGIDVPRPERFLLDD